MKSTQSGSAKPLSIVILLIAVLSLFSLVIFNTNVSRDESVISAWAEVINQYKRRADLIPNLVNTVQGYASHEASTLKAVTEARAAVNSIRVSAENIDPETFKKFQAAQGELGTALSRLMVVAESYPDLKANQGFRDLQAQLEGTENRIAVARRRYIESVKEYNVGIRSFPGNLFAGLGGFQTRPNFQVGNEAEISAAPKIEFNKK